MADVVLEATVSLDDLLRLGEDARVEVIHGRIIEMSPVGGLHHVIAGNLHDLVKAHVNRLELGIVFMDGLLFLMNEKPKRLRGSFVPDLSFVRGENIPVDWDITKPFPGVPDLAVEVVSPDDNAMVLNTKVRAYLEKGTVQVWVVYPQLKEVHQFRRDDLKTARIYQGDETMEIEALFPGLSLSLTDIFKLPKWAQK